jgi:FlaA1/EpsC-like NDP-sugar epimerase
VQGADIVVNAAALKQVPTCEYFPVQAIATNCDGPSNIVRAIREHAYAVEAVVGISTDKACKPVNVMGMTKALQAANVLSPRTRFICVRHGNVLASRGSVIPLFLDQIRQGGPVTITDPGMTRFLLSLDQAVDTVFAALADARPGETYIPRTPSATVMNIARALIGTRTIALETIGVRPGEKMHEILVSEEEVPHCVERGEYYVIQSMLPELNPETAHDGLKTEYSSADRVLSAEATAALLRHHGLAAGAGNSGASCRSQSSPGSGRARRSSS